MGYILKPFLPVGKEGMFYVIKKGNVIINIKIKREVNL
jgi:hypothetical protein